MSDSLQPHGLQHARPPCPSPTPRVCSNSCPLSQWCHPTISSSVIPFSPGPQSFPASGSFLMSQFFTSGGQSIGVSASVLPMNIQDQSPLRWTGWSPCSPRDSQESSLIPQFKLVSYFETLHWRKEKPRAPKTQGWAYISHSTLESLWSCLHWQDVKDKQQFRGFHNTI